MVILLRMNHSAMQVCTVPAPYIRPAARLGINGLRQCAAQRPSQTISSQNTKKKAMAFLFWKLAPFRIRRCCVTPFSASKPLLYSLLGFIRLGSVLTLCPATAPCFFYEARPPAMCCTHCAQTAGQSCNA